MARVLVVSPTRLYREGLAHALDGRRGIEIIGAVPLSETLHSIRAGKPDIALLDLAEPDSLLAVRAVRAARLNVRVVVLSLPEAERRIISCVEAGIDGYLTGEASLADVIEVIEGVSSGEARASPKIVASLFRRVAMLATERGGPGETAHLTRREHEIVALLDEGLSNKEIAGRLSIQVSTAKNHVHNILEKLRVEGRAEAPSALRRAGVEPLRASRVGDEI